MYSHYLPSGVQTERRERAYVDTGCHTHKSSRPATSCQPKPCTVSGGYSDDQQGRFRKEGHGQWSVSRPVDTVPKGGYGGYSVVQQGDLEKKAMVSDGYSLVQQRRFGKEGHGQ